MSTNDQTLPELAMLRDVVRAERRDAAPWEALARGEGGPEGLVDPTALAIFGPIGVDARARMVERVMATARETARSDRPGAAASPAMHLSPALHQGASVARPASHPGAKVVLLRKAAIVLAPLLAAAGVAFVALGPGGSVPRYELSAAQGVEATRSGATENTARTRLAPSTKLDTVARPETAHDAGLIGRAYLRQAGEVLPMRAELVRSPDGAFRLRGRAGELLPRWQPGVADIVIVVGRERSMPRASELRAGQAEGQGYRVLTMPVELLAGG